MDVKFTWIPTWHQMGHVLWLLGFVFENCLLEVGLTRNREIMALWTFTTVGLFYLYHVWGPAWIETHWNSIWLRIWSRMTSHYTWGSVDHTTWSWRCVGTAFGRFLLGSHNFMVMALGSCVKWPSHTRLRARDHCTSSILIGGKRWAGPSSLHTTLEGSPEWVQDGCKVDMDSYVTSKGQYFMVTWILFLF